MLVMVQAQLIKSMYRGVNAPSILDAVSREAEIYFAIISSSHLSVVIIFFVARVGLFAPVLEFNVC
jgi:hypothetical protein